MTELEYIVSQVRANNSVFDSPTWGRRNVHIEISAWCADAKLSLVSLVSWGG